MGVKNNVSSPEVCTHNAGGQLPTRQCIWESPVLGGRLHSTDVNLAIFVNNSSAIFNLHFLIHLHGDGRVGEIFSLLTCMRQTRWNVSFVTFGQMCVLSCVQLFVTPWIVACQAPLSMGFSRQRILEWVAISYSRGSSLSRDWNCVSCISCVSCTGRQILYHCTPVFLYGWYRLYFT